MNRRGFLKAIGIGVGTVAVAPLMPFVPAPAPKRPSLSTRVIRDYDVRTDSFVSRIDVLYGVAVIRPELSCRVLA